MPVVKPSFLNKAAAEERFIKNFQRYPGWRKDFWTETKEAVKDAFVIGLVLFVFGLAATVPAAIAEALIDKDNT